MSEAHTIHLSVIIPWKMHMIWGHGLGSPQPFIVIGTPDFATACHVEPLQQFTCITVPPDFLLPRLLFILCLHKDAVGVADKVRNNPASQGPRHVPRARRCFGTAYPLLFFLFWLCGCILCVYRSMLSVYTRPRKAQSVRPMIEYEMPPQPRAHGMSRARGAALAKPTPCFSSYFGCAAAIPRVQKDAPGRGWGATC